MPIPMPTRAEARKSLDAVIRKSRVHLYKPIQIAEILYHDRAYHDVDLNDLETYRNRSKIRWLWQGASAKRPHRRTSM